MANQTEMCIMGLKRSGNHAVINWIGQQFPGDRVYFLNNCKPGENPYDTKHSEDSDETILFNGFRVNRRSQRFDEKDCLIYSYENRPLRAVHNDVARSNHDAWIGTSLKRYDVLLLRDPFNLVASSLKRDINQGKSKSSLWDRYVKLKTLWIEYATEFIGQSNHLINNKTVISFNAWTKNRDYRRELAARLGLNFTDAGVDEVVSVGGGSSFDGQQLDGAGHSMELENRWQNFKSDSFFTNLLCDEHVLELSNQIFGTVPGVEDWFSSVRGLNR